jgi:hypothetical protein
MTGYVSALVAMSALILAMGCSLALLFLRDDGRTPRVKRIQVTGMAAAVIGLGALVIWFVVS